MPLNYIFIGFIGIVTIIRLGLIVAGPADIRAKTEKAGFWIIGLVCVVISWIALGSIFGVNTNGFGHSRVTETTKNGLQNDEKPINSGTYYGTGYEEEQKEVPIKIEGNK